VTIRRRVLVTGASGKIGKLLVNELLKQGYDVVALSSGPRVDYHSNLQWVQIDWRNLENLDLPEIDTVILTAHQTSAYKARDDIESDIHSNLISTIRLLNSLKKNGSVPAVIYLGSVTEFGSITKLPLDENSPVRPETFYEVSKFTVGEYLKQFFREKDLSGLWILRLSNVYGFQSNPLNPHRGFFDRTINEAINGREICYFGDGEYRRDFIHALDVIKAILLTIKMIPKTGINELNIASGSSISLKDALERIKFHVENQLGVQVRLGSLDFPASAYDLEARDVEINIQKVTETLYWKPKIDLDTGIRMKIQEFLTSSQV